MNKIEQFMEKWNDYFDYYNVGYFSKEMRQDLKSLMDSAVKEYLQEKLNDYDVGSLEYKLIETILKPKEK